MAPPPKPHCTIHIAAIGCTWMRRLHQAQLHEGSFGHNQVPGPWAGRHSPSPSQPACSGNAVHVAGHQQAPVKLNNEGWIVQAVNINKQLSHTLFSPPAR